LKGRTFAIGNVAADENIACVSDTGCGLADWFAMHEAVAVLIRPDFYVYGIAAAADDLGAIIAELASTLSRRSEHAWNKRNCLRNACPILGQRISTLTVRSFVAFVAPGRRGCGSQGQHACQKCVTGGVPGSRRGYV